mmetsp:Transcript_58134/g.125647  ORF Transcript_58134/g.125647 Transcript_58134/m.125647 type:complete len:346 (+) Transcript_58134:61-1098(+)
MEQLTGEPLKISFSGLPGLWQTMETPQTFAPGAWESSLLATRPAASLLRPRAEWPQAAMNTPLSVPLHLEQATLSCPPAAAKAPAPGRSSRASRRRHGGGRGKKDALGCGRDPGLASTAPLKQRSGSDVGTYYSVDVECVASGPRHSDRVVAQIALVDAAGDVVLDLFVKPSVPVLSYLTPLTGLTRELLEERGVSLDEALSELRRLLPKESILVGQSIQTDVAWLGLEQGTDFAGMMDLAGLWRVRNPKFGSWTIFGQEHLAKVLLGDDLAGGAHNAAEDAIKSMKLFNLHRQLVARGPEVVEEAKLRVLAQPLSLSFARRYPTFEGVCMGNRRMCTCGAPFFG